MKLSDQLRLLLELEGRVSAIEKILYRMSSGQPPPQLEGDTKKPKPKKENKKKLDLKNVDLSKMSKTELAQAAFMNGYIQACRGHQREDLEGLIRGEAVVIEDPLEAVRDQIYYFITKVQPSLRQTLRCSCDCRERCPASQVVDCWTSNKDKIEELTK